MKKRFRVSYLNDEKFSATTKSLMRRPNLKRPTNLNASQTFERFFKKADEKKRFRVSDDEKFVMTMKSLL